jgi:hypothetical protein
VQSRIGAALGGDLSGVRVHTGDGAARYAAAQGASAITVGRDIAFAPGRYAPGTPVGDALLAHELAHALQQTDSAPQTSLLEDPALENEADLAALDTVAALYLPGGAVRGGQISRRAHLAPQRCGDGDLKIPAQPAPRPYVEIVKELKVLKGRKQAVLDGKEPEASLPDINKRIAEVGDELRRMGVRLETAEILDRLEAEPATDLLQVRGQIVRTPTGKVSKGTKLAFQAVLDYVPPGRLVQYAWRWKAKGDSFEAWFGDTGKRGSTDHVDIGSGFWTGQTTVDKGGGMEVVAYVYLGDEKTETLRLTTGVIELTDPHPETYKLKTSQSVTIKDAPVTIEMADWAPRLGEYWIDWDIDGSPVAEDWLLLSHRFTKVGTRTVTAHVNRRGDTVFRSRGPRVADPSITITVQDPEQSAEQMIALMTGVGAPPATERLAESLDSAIKETERHVAEGGEQRDFWVSRLKALRKQRDRLHEEIPDLETAATLPTDPGAVTAGQSYSGPLKAVLILPSGGGPQPLTIHVRSWQEGATWNARIVDLTSSDVYSRSGSGSTPIAAYEGAFRAWMDSHPYPRGGKVRYEFPIPGWTLPTTFKCRDTAWETVKAWVDGILTVGGVVVGGLLLLTPEPTGATKALGYLFITASVARSAIAIYENLQLGIDPLDGRNVVEGLSILTSVLGVSGSLMRQYGIKAVSPLVYRVGNWTVMASLAGDVGTMAFVGQEALAQLRATQADPTKTDAEKNGEWLRVASQLFASGAMFFVTNKDLLKQGLRPSDFFKTDPRAGGGVKPLSTGSRLDIALELKKVGDVHTAARVSSGKIPDSELLDRHAALPWLRTGAPPDVAEIGRRLSPATLAAVQDVPVKRVREALDALADDPLFERLAARYKSGVKVGDVSTGVGRINAALSAHPDRVASVKRAADLEASGKVTGFDEWVKQTAARLPNVGTPSAEQVLGTRELTGELDALAALAQDVAGDPNKLVRFTPAPPTVPGTPTPRSFDIAIGDRAAGVAGPPERLVEVYTLTGEISGSLDLNPGVAHAAAKLPLDRPVPVPGKKGGPKGATVTPGATLPTASKEAAVVATKWPPAPKGGRKVYAADGSWVLTLDNGMTKTGHTATDLMRDLNGPGLDDNGAQFLDRVSIIDGNGRKVFSLVNDVDPASVSGARHKWRVE